MTPEVHVTRGVGSYRPLVVGAVIGVGFLLDGAKDSFGKGGSSEKGKNISKDIFWFVVVVCLFGALPKLLGLGGGFFDYL